MKWQINKFITARREHNGLTVRHKITICLAVLASAVALTACGSAESADAVTSVSSLVEKIPDDDPTRQAYLNQEDDADDQEEQDASENASEVITVDTGEEPTTEDSDELQEDIDATDEASAGFTFADLNGIEFYFSSGAGA